MDRPPRRFLNLLQEFSLPLIVGVVCSLFAANLAPDAYAYWFGTGHGEGVWEVPGGLRLFGHHLTLNFLINDIFMVLFFGIAAKEITEACLPGGSLSPLKSAVNPLFATLGGIVGPVAVFFLLLWLSFSLGYFPEGMDWDSAAKGWGIPTATDIALAWLVARAVFGRGHPAVDFLLLLAVADDAIGLGIIAIFYGDPTTPADPRWLGLVVCSMVLAYGMRRIGLRHWLWTVGICGPLSWSGLVLAHLHPALALVPIIPFLEGPRRDTGMFEVGDEVDRMGEPLAEDLNIEHSPLHRFEESLKLFVDFGLFFFAFANAGVAFSQIGPMTWIVLGALVFGKLIGITAFGLLAIRIGFPLPRGMRRRDLVMAGFVAALGLTVALFVAGAAFPGGGDGLLGQAKMGALFSGLVGLLAIGLGRVLVFGSAGQSGGSAVASPVDPDQTQD